MMRAAGVSVFGTLAFAVCHVVILMTEDMGADPEHVWMMALIFGVLGALGAGAILARGVPQSFWEHVGLCTGAYVAALVSAPRIGPTILMVLALVGAGAASWEMERIRLRDD